MSTPEVEITHAEIGPLGDLHGGAQRAQKILVNVVKYPSHCVNWNPFFLLLCRLLLHCAFNTRLCRAATACLAVEGEGFSLRLRFNPLKNGTLGWRFCLFCRIDGCRCHLNRLHRRHGSQLACLAGKGLVKRRQVFAGTALGQVQRIGKIDALGAYHCSAWRSASACCGLKLGKPSSSLMPRTISCGLQSLTFRTQTNSSITVTGAVKSCSWASKWRTRAY